MMWDYPLLVEIDGEKLEIENDCDYRVVLDCLNVYEDVDIDLQNQHKLALCFFYKEPWKIKDAKKAAMEMIRIIDCDSEEEFENKAKQSLGNRPRIMSWKKDFKFIAPAVSRVLGYDVRTPDKYTHWWTFMSAFREIGECTWSTIISIRNKKINNQKLEKWEEKIYRDYKYDIDLPIQLTAEEQEMLNSEW